MNADINTEKDQEILLLKARWFWAVIIALVLILGISWIAFSKTLLNTASGIGGEAVVLEPAPVAGHPAPDFELASTEGQPVRLSDFRGKPVILNFWATWCAPCRAEFPEFQKAAVDNADRLVIIGVNNTTADQPDLVPDFLKEFGVTFPIVLDEKGETIKTYRILGLPTTVFIDSNGIVNEVFTGPLNKAYIESKISELNVEPQ
jgi:thiol-disulfide isomerase/thioredoxin